MIYAAAAEQLATLQDEQHASRHVVELYMAAYEKSEVMLRAAQRRETQLTELLCTARQHTARLMRDFDDAERRLRTATEHLAATQARCHSLESQLASYVKCQRCAVLLLPQLTTPPPAFTSQPRLLSSARSEQETTREASRQQQLCWMDPFCLLHVSSGSVLSYDLVAACDSHEDTDVGEDAKQEHEGSTAQTMPNEELSDAEGGVVAAAAAHSQTTITSLLRDVVHDALQGFDYTLLSTSAADEAASPGHSLAMTMPGPLSRRLLALLQSEAARCGTQALSVSLAIGRVTQSALTEAADLEDVLLPFLSELNAAAQRGRQEGKAAESVKTVLMSAVVGEDEDAEKSDRGRATSVNTCGSDNGSSTSRYSTHQRGASRLPRFALRNPNVPPWKTSTTKEQHVVASSSTTVLTGVQVGSVAEVDEWLSKAGLLSCDKDGAGVTSPCVVLMGVDAQDAAGKVHKALLRILSDAAFVKANTYLPSTEATSQTVFSESCKPVPEQPRLVSAPPSPLSPPLPLSASLCFHVMFHAVVAVLRTVCGAHGQASTSDAASQLVSHLVALYERNTAACAVDVESVTQMLWTAPQLCPSAAEARAVLQSIAACPRAVERQFTSASAGCVTAEVARQGVRAMWATWVALLRPVFGGNSKAIWLHATRSSTMESAAPRPGKVHRGTHEIDDGERMESRERATAVAGDDSSSSLVALTLCALFCRLVRHDAVPCEVSADLARLLHERGL